MIKKTSFAIAVLLCSVLSCIASERIATMSQCQVLFKFLDARLADANSPVNAQDAQSIRSALSLFDSYIQNDLIVPAVLEYSGGNAAEAATLQAQIEAVKLWGLHNFLKENYVLTTYHVGLLERCLKGPLDIANTRC